MMTAPSLRQQTRSPRALFGRRKGHRLRPQQTALIASLLPKLAIELGTPPPLRLGDLFPLAPDEVHLEIGFGGGEHFIAEAERQPHVGFIGIEPFLNGMAKALVAIEAKRLTNVRLHFG